MFVYIVLFKIYDKIQIYYDVRKIVYLTISLLNIVLTVPKSYLKDFDCVKKNIYINNFYPGGIWISSKFSHVVGDPIFLVLEIQ